MLSESILKTCLLETRKFGRVIHTLGKKEVSMKHIQSLMKQIRLFEEKVLSVLQYGKFRHPFLTSNSSYRRDNGDDIEEEEEEEEVIIDTTTMDQLEYDTLCKAVLQYATGCVQQDILQTIQLEKKNVYMGLLKTTRTSSSSFADNKMERNNILFYRVSIPPSSSDKSSSSSFSLDPITVEPTKTKKVLLSTGSSVIGAGIVFPLPKFPKRRIYQETNRLIQQIDPKKLYRVTIDSLSQDGMKILSGSIKEMYPAYSSVGSTRTSLLSDKIFHETYPLVYQQYARIEKFDTDFKFHTDMMEDLPQSVYLTGATLRIYLRERM
jgi:hypothetical protein